VRTSASFALPNNVTATFLCDLAMPPKLLFIPRMPQLSVVVRCEGGEVRLFNFIMPTLYHWIEVSVRGGHKRVEKVYAFREDKSGGETWWTTCVTKLFHVAGD
jgi:hypothetical protein